MNSTTITFPWHWKLLKLKDVGKIISGGTPSTSISEFWNDEVSWITPADLSNYNSKYISKGRKSISTLGLKKSSARLLPRGSVLFSSRAPIGYVAIAASELATNQGFKSIIPDKCLNSDYLYYYLKSIKSLAEQRATGTTFKEISATAFSNLQIPVPPANVQKVIVKKIEELFSKLDKGVEQLEILQQQLKIYRQAVLKYAFEGKLTNLGVNDGELPQGWKIVTFNDVSIKIGDIDHKMPKSVESGYPYISTKDFTNDLKISFKEAKYISEEDYLALSRKIKPERGDIIFPRYGTIGKNILIDFEKQFLVSYSCAIIKLNRQAVLPKYAYLYSLSPQITDEIRKYVVETTQANIGIASIKRFVFPLPSKDQQELIIREIESRLSVCDKIEETIQSSLKQAEALRQSILKKAFSGKLVKEEEELEPGVLNEI